MTNQELLEKIKVLGYTADGLKKKPIDFMSLVLFASHFYSLGFSDAINNVTENFDVADMII